MRLGRKVLALFLLSSAAAVSTLHADDDKSVNPGGSGDQDLAAKIESYASDWLSRHDSELR
jgi:hypothetical protein